MTKSLLVLLALFISTSTFAAVSDVTCKNPVQPNLKGYELNLRDLEVVIVNSDRDQVASNYIDRIYPRFFMEATWINNVKYEKETVFQYSLERESKLKSIQFSKTNGTGRAMFTSNTGIETTIDFSDCTFF